MSRHISHDLSRNILRHGISLHVTKHHNTPQPVTTTRHGPPRHLMFRRVTLGGLPTKHAASNRTHPPRTKHITKNATHAMHNTHPLIHSSHLLSNPPRHSLLPPHPISGRTQSAAAPNQRPHPISGPTANPPRHSLLPPPHSPTQSAGSGSWVWVTPSPRDRSCANEQPFLRWAHAAHLQQESKQVLRLLAHLHQGCSPSWPATATR